MTAFSEHIAIQGEAGSFSHEAVLRLLPQAVPVPCPLSDEVFARVVSGSVDGAVIPIENSLAGSVVEHYDLLFSHPLQIEREVLIRIRHMLIAAPGTSLAEVRRVYSHPVALAQCRRFFEQHPDLTAAPFYDTAGSVKRLVEQGEPGDAAIAGRAAVAVYGASVLLEGVEDHRENYTRFFLVRRAGSATNPQASKVSVAFAVENRPGSLVAALQVFAGLGTNLTRLESRPIPGQPWHYIFYADYELPPGSSGKADRAVELLRAHCSAVKELGRYEPARLPGEEG